MTQTTGPAHIARAAVDSVAHQICDVVDVIEHDADSLTTFRADGGITVSDLAMQTQADLLGTAVEVADIAEISARGAAQLGWQALSTWPADAAGAKRSRTFDPKITTSDRAARRALWRAEVARARFRPPVEPRTRS
jgi:glycerol kinase